jgi:hypothetical protein
MNISKLIPETNRIKIPREFGFLNVKIENNGTTLVGESYTNDGRILDHFKLNNTS